MPFNMASLCRQHPMYDFGRTALMTFAICCLVGAGSATAACRSGSRVLAQTLGLSSSGPMNSGARFFRASAYITAGCLREALVELDFSDTALNREGLSDSGFRLRKRNGEALRNYILALQRLDKGQRQAAVDQLLQLLETNRSTEVMWRTTMTLGDLLIVQSKPDEWERFMQHMSALAASDAKFWQADLFRRLKDVRDGKGQSAIAALGEELSSELSSQRHFSLQVVLVEVLVADGRHTNARVYCSWADAPIGEGLLDIEQRLRFLKACRAAWKASSSTKNTDVASRTSRVFDIAIGKFEDEL